jgi:hypothetical protein
MADIPRKRERRLQRWVQLISWRTFRLCPGARVRRLRGKGFPQSGRRCRQNCQVGADVGLPSSASTSILFFEDDKAPLASNAEVDSRPVADSLAIGGNLHVQVVRQFLSWPVISGKTRRIGVWQRR